MFIDYLNVVCKVGYSDLLFGWFLLFGDLVGLFVLMFVFLLLVGLVFKGSVWCEFECCYESYKCNIVILFFCDYFVWIDW